VAAKRSPRSDGRHTIQPTNSRSRLDFQILGPLEATRGKRPLALGSPKQRALLAFLLLHSNELVSRDRLIEELWGDAAPATVNAVLNGYLTKLRRLLDGDGEVLATRPPGYILRVPDEQLDARRFESLLEQGREALRHGDAGRSAATLRAALSLWRGPALADLTYEQFAQTEIKRLEELRLAALEDRIEADLALGRHEALVPELETLATEHPYRERLQAQLMLALYRSGRQAEALEAYQRARHTLVEDVGIDPGMRLQQLERAILRQDPSLEPPERPAARRAPPRARTRRVPAAIVGLSLAVAIAAALVAALREQPRAAKPVTLAGDSVAVIDPQTTSIVAEIALGGRPSGIAIGEGSVWVGNLDDNLLVRIDPRSRKIDRRIGLSATPSEVAVGLGSVWVLSSTASSVFRVSPVTSDVLATIRLRPSTERSAHLAIAPSGVWVAHGWFSGALSRIDPATNTAELVRRADIEAVAYAERALWVLTRSNRIERVDPSTNSVVDTISLTGIGETEDSGYVGAGAGAVWTAPAGGTELWKIDPASGRFLGRIPLGRVGSGGGFGERTLWIISADGALLKVDAEAEKVVKTIQLGAFANAWQPVAVGDDAVWVAVIR
jgi:DNA-binding SARP family transcriptional activator/streptogramin lyase